MAPAWQSWPPTSTGRPARLMRQSRQQRGRRDRAPPGRRGGRASRRAASRRRSSRAAYEAVHFPVAGDQRARSVQGWQVVLSGCGRLCLRRRDRAQLYRPLRERHRARADVRLLDLNDRHPSFDRPQSRRHRLDGTADPGVPGSGRGRRRPFPGRFSRGAAGRRGHRRRPRDHGARLRKIFEQQKQTLRGAVPSRPSPTNSWSRTASTSSC